MQARVERSDPDPGLAAYGGAWRASLRVDLAREGERCIPVKLAHSGPLRIQKVLYPEGPSLAHLILLHPPAGIAGGDALTLDFRLLPGAAMLLTTPGAGRWYRGDSLATQQIRISVAEGASLEWLPQETVLHDGMRGEQGMEVEIAPGGTAIGMEVQVLGRKASGESLHTLHYAASLRLRLGDRLLLAEQTRICDAAPGLAAMAGLHVSGLLWAVSPEPMAPTWAETVESCLDQTLGQVSRPILLAERPLAGASLVDPHLLLVRVAGASPQAVRQTLIEAWRLLRPALTGRAAISPRIWTT